MSTVELQKNEKKIICFSRFSVPTVLLVDVIEREQHFFESICEKNKTYEHETWISYFAKEICNKTKRSQSASERLIRDVLSVKSLVTNVESAEHILFGLGLYLDIDVQLPVIPGSYKTCAELLLTRAQLICEEVTKKDISSFVVPTLELSTNILYDPYNASKYQDQAPFDCLRPPK